MGSGSLRFCKTRLLIIPLFFIFLGLSCLTTKESVITERIFPNIDANFVTNTESSKIIDSQSKSHDSSSNKISYDGDLLPNIDRKIDLLSVINSTKISDSSPEIVIEGSYENNKKREKIDFNNYNLKSRVNLNKNNSNDSFEKNENKSIKNYDSEYSSDKYLSNEEANNFKNNNINLKNSNIIKESVEDKSFDLTNNNFSKIDEREEKRVEVNENDEFTISISGTGWIIKSIVAEGVKFLKRNFVNENTIFVFKSGYPGNFVVTFVKNNDQNMEKVAYLIKVKPRLLTGNDKKENKNKKDDIKKQKQNKGDKEDYRKKLANELFNQNKFDEAKVRYQTIMDEGNPDSEIYYKMGIIEKEFGKHQQALEFFNKNIEEKNNPYFSNAIYEIMNLLKRQQKYSEAIDIFYNHVVGSSLDSSDTESLSLLLSDIYFNMKDYLSASNEYRRFIELFPASLYLDKALFYLAYSIENLNNNSDYKEAYRLYKELIEKYPESKYRKNSKDRILYLERHYLKIN